MENITNWIQKSSDELLNKVPEKDTKTISAALACTTVLVYLGIVRYLRYKNIKSIIKKYPDPQQVLDDPAVAKEIYSMTMSKEFPFLGRQGTELALFKTYAIPTISKILAGTGELGKRCPRRVEDTELILGEMLHTYSRIQKQLKINPNTPKEDIEAQWLRPQEATARLNEIHGNYTILNDDYLYTAALFVTEPQSWINRFDWRKLDVRESNALFRVWYDISVSMNLKNIPDTQQKLIDFKNAYAKENTKYSPSNWKCGEPTVKLLVSGFLPAFLRERGYAPTLKLLPSVLDLEDVQAFELPYSESKLLTWSVHSVLGIRAFVLRHFMLPRSNYVSRTPFYANEKNCLVPEFFIYKPHIYENGYVISDLGPEKKERK